MRKKFDFDSFEPVQGNVVDEQREKEIRDFEHWIIDKALAIGVVAAGACLCKWWYYGGFRVVMAFFFKHSGGIMSMAQHGL